MAQLNLTMACSVVWAIMLSVVSVKAILEIQPEQIHISSTNDITEMVVTWSTFNNTNTSVVQFGFHGNLSYSAVGSSTKFVDGGPEKHTQYIHRVKMTSLKPNLTYSDFAYDFDFDNARVGDSFMNQIESVAAYLPYMTCPGNHEEAYNFSNYKNRFTMPNYEGTQNLWYSWNIGPAHIISLSTEVYFFFNYGLHQIKNQLEWLIADLEEANSPEARRQRPWIITIGHRPPYCSDVVTRPCNLVYAETVRSALEDTLYKYGVDLSFWGHEHNYERFWPLYNYKVHNGSLSEPYTNPTSPVHIITGSAGCSEEHSSFGPMRYFDAFRSSDYGYTRLQIINDTHINMQQVSDDQ
ncbi:hypothetical protein BSL78_02894, partial [Apostichopus japonicus]